MGKNPARPSVICASERKKVKNAPRKQGKKERDNFVHSYKIDKKLEK
jgi:hypothetical protein